MPAAWTEGDAPTGSRSRPRCPLQLPLSSVPDRPPLVHARERNPRVDSKLNLRSASAFGQKASGAPGSVVPETGGSKLPSTSHVPHLPGLA